MIKIGVVKSSYSKQLFQQFLLAASLFGLIVISACNYPIPGQVEKAAPTQTAMAAIVEEMYATAVAQATAVVEGISPTLPTAPFPTQPPVENQVTPSPLPITQTAPVFDPTALTFDYLAQAGDTLPAVAERFGVGTVQIRSSELLPEQSFLHPGQMLVIPNALDEFIFTSVLLPDSAVVNSPAAISLDIYGYITSLNGFLNGYEEIIDEETFTGAEIVHRVVQETSVNPQLLLAFLEYRSGWVRGLPEDSLPTEYPIGFFITGYKGLYKELLLVAKQLNTGYYGWRSGTITHLAFPNAATVRMSPQLNAGSVALQYLFADFYRYETWQQNLYGPHAFMQLYLEMFGDPWVRAEQTSPLIPGGLVQPQMELPFNPGERWSLTAGPHSAWTTGTPRGSLDFAPVTGEPACAVSKSWVTASAPGLVVRAENNIVAIDLDGDGYEQTGWVLIYMHVAEKDIVSIGTWVNQDDRIGHPSCEGGRATGTHIHLVRKYNGEWLAADGPVPFVLSGWRAYQGERSFDGYLLKDGVIVQAQPDGSSSSTIIR